MNARSYATAMANYNRWMNQVVYGCASELTDEERKRDLGAFFGSIHRTLNHIYVTDEAWMQRLAGEPIAMTSPRERRFESFEQLWQARTAMDERLARWADGLTDAFTDNPFRFRSVTYQRELEIPGWAVVVQVFNHQTHHRGQVTTLLMQLGKDPGATDIPVMPGVMQDH